MVSVALIDDNRLVRDGLNSCLSALPDIRIVASVAGADTSILAEVDPDVVLLDLGPGNADDLAVVGRVRMEVPDARIIAIGLLPDPNNLLDVIRAGVSGFALLEATPEDLVSTIRAVVSGHNVLPHQVTGALFTQIAAVAPNSGPIATHGVQLTSRQREVIELISEGMSNKRIAAELHISVHTVKSHIRHIMKKLDRNTRLQISAWAYDEEEG
jgi:two-component system, NarL family, response regulator DevR